MDRTPLGPAKLPSSPPSPDDTVVFFHLFRRETARRFILVPHLMSGLLLTTVKYSAINTLRWLSVYSFNLNFLH